MGAVTIAIGAVTIGAVTIGVLAVALRAGGGLATGLPGLPDPGPVVRWGLPAVRLLSDLLAAGTVGLTATAAFLVPGEPPADRALLGAPGYRLLRRAGWCAAAWAASAAALAALAVADLLGRPVSAVGTTAVRSFVGSVPQGQALACQVAVAAAVAVAGRLVIGRVPAAFTALAALAGVLPPALTGHAAAAGDHQLAVTSLALHVVAASLWAGGLIGLIALRRSPDLAATAARFGRLAMVCFVAVAGTGVINAGVRLGAVDQLWRSSYGTLVIVKTCGLLALGGAGLLHRRRAIAAMAAGRPAGFLRVLLGEFVVIGATFAVAVAMSRVDRAGHADGSGSGH
jgi:putative copper resistance protein D